MYESILFLTFLLYFLFFTIIIVYCNITVFGCCDTEMSLLTRKNKGILIVILTAPTCEYNVHELPQKHAHYAK